MSFIEIQQRWQTRKLVFTDAEPRNATGLYSVDNVMAVLTVFSARTEQMANLRKKTQKTISLENLKQNAITKNVKKSEKK